MNLAYKKKEMSEVYQDVNYVKHWNYVGEMMMELRTIDNKPFGPSHKSLYDAVFQVWNKTGFKAKFTAYRDELMDRGLISSTATYHKVMDDLVNAGLIIYQSNRSRYKPSTIEVHRCDVVNSSSLKIEPVNKLLNEQQECDCDEIDVSSSSSSLVSSSSSSLKIKHFPKLPKHSKLPKQEKKETPLPPFENSDCSKTETSFDTKAEKKERKTSGKKKESSRAADCKQPTKFVKPKIDQVFDYMIEKGLPENEAEYQSEEFIDRYEAGGWMVGKNKMRDWNASVRNWLRNMDKWNNRKYPVNQNGKQRTSFQEMAQRAKETADSITFEDIKNL